MLSCGKYIRDHAHTNDPQILRVAVCPGDTEWDSENISCSYVAPDVVDKDHERCSVGR